MDAYTELVERDAEGGVTRVAGYVYPQGTTRDFEVELPSIRGISAIDIGTLVAAAELDYMTRRVELGQGYEPNV